MRAKGAAAFSSAVQQVLGHRRESRFTRFLEGLPGAESIDRFALPDDPQHRRKADFLLANRNVVVELKTLTEDPSHKVDATVDKHRGREDWPLFYGTANVRKVLSNLPDGESIYGKMVNALGRSVETAVRSAEEQVTHTRRVLGLPNAAGLLVILNDSIDVLDPYVVGHRVAQLMRRPRTGNSEAEKVDFAWLLFESHAMGMVQGRPAVPSFLINGEGKDKFPWFKNFHHDLVRRWADSNGGITLEGKSTNPSAITFVPMKEATAVPPELLPRHEWWRRQYHARPYMRALSDDELLARGAEIVRRVTPHFLKGRPGSATDVIGALMEEFTHFIEEMNFRGLDMRRIPKQ
jgi:hypothetical protein